MLDQDECGGSAVLEAQPESEDAGRSADDLALLQEALNGLKSWLQGSGLTSPGSASETPVVKEELLQIDQLSARLDVAGDLSRMRWGRSDLRRARAALEVLHEETDSVSWLLGSPGDRQWQADPALARIECLLGRLAPASALAPTVS